MLAEDKIIDEKVGEMANSKEYGDYMEFLSSSFFKYSEDFFTNTLYEMGTAS
jgi:hypothetical protein